MTTPRYDRSVWFLCGAAFAMAAALSTWWTAMPYLVRRAGGTEAHVGLAPALNMLCYGAALLVVGRSVGINVRRATRWAASLMAGSCLISLVAVTRPTGPVTLTTVYVLIAAGMVSGAAMALFWPLLMAWVSADLEGAALTQRLGSFNRGWSGAVLFGPLLGAGLVDRGVGLPLVAASLWLGLCWLGLTAARAPRTGGTRPTRSTSGTTGTGVELRWMARVALLCNWAAMAITRSQFALRFTDLGFRTVGFGLLVTLSAVVNFAVLTAVGRWHGWHGRRAWLFLAPLLGALSLLGLAWGRTLPVFRAALALQGAALAMSYSAHQYYGAAGRAERSGPMALHELVIATATILGSAPAGILAVHAGPQSPYLFGLSLCALAATAQMALAIRHRR